MIYCYSNYLLLLLQDIAKWLGLSVAFGIVFILIKLNSEDGDYSGPVISTFLVSVGKLESPGFYCHSIEM